MRAFPARLPRSITDFLKDKSGATNPLFFSTFFRLFRVFLILTN